MKQVTKQALAEFAESINNYRDRPGCGACGDSWDLLMVLQFLADGDTNAAFEKALGLNNGTAEVIPLEVWKFMEDSEA